MISLSITVVMGSVYLLSLQLMDSSQVNEEEEVVQESKETEVTEKASAEASHGHSPEKDHHESAHSKDEKHVGDQVAKPGIKKEPAEQGAEHSEQSTKTQHGKGESHEEASVDEGNLDLSKKYRPRIIGRCKVLYERFNKVELQANQFHSFAYSFDGKSGYCADSGPQTSMKLAKEIALSDCEKNKGSTESYAPCFIYSSEK